MLIAHYLHRLPAEHDLAGIRARAQQRGPLWDAMPELGFKAFLLRERGQHGAIANSYSSLYLWRQESGFRDFLVDGRYRTVTESFGRAAIATRTVLDARRGHAREARFAWTEELDIPPDADLTTSFAEEIARNRATAERPGTVAAAVGIDPQRWRFTRVLLSDREPAGGEAGIGYQILYLARPLLETLPLGADA